MLRILLIIAVAVAVIIGLVTLTRHNQESVVTPAPTGEGPAANEAPVEGSSAAPGAPSETTVPETEPDAADLGATDEAPSQTGEGADAATEPQAEAPGSTGERAMTPSMDQAAGASVETGSDAADVPADVNETMEPAAPISAPTTTETPLTEESTTPPN